MPVSTVSRKVTALEERLAVTLLQRTTRKLSLTAQGRAYYNQCSEPLSHLLAAELNDEDLVRNIQEVAGLARLTTPTRERFLRAIEIARKSEAGHYLWHNPG